MNEGEACENGSLAYMGRYLYCLCEHHRPLWPLSIHPCVQPAQIAYRIISCLVQAHGALTSDLNQKLCLTRMPRPEVGNNGVRNAQ